MLRLILAKRFFFRTGLFLAICFMFFTNCGSDEGGGSNGSGRGRGMFSGGMNSQMSAAIPVQVAVAKRGDISTFLLQTTTIEAQRQVDILAKVAGQVVKLPVEEGTRVKKGDLVAQLDEAELKIDFMQAEVRLETDKTTLQRAQNMLEKNLIAEENYETTRLQYESSKAAYEAARLRLDYTSVRSPIDGVITLRNVEIGQRVNINQSLFTVADFNPLRAKIYVPEKDMGRIFKGQAAKITVEAEPGLEFSGVVKMVSPVVDPASGTSKVTIDIDEHQGKLKPGMFASVFISTETHKNALLVPKKALILESDVDQVYIYKDGNAHKVNLKLGFASGDDIEILSGLKDGDQVVTIGQEGLREGLPIRIPGQEAAVAGQGDTKESPASASGQGRQMGGRSGEGRPMGPGNDRPVDPERLKRMEERLMQNPIIKKEYEKRLKEDPDLKNNPQKKMAFFREMFRKMRGGQGRPRN
ncbi:MAG: efflux RND transporter periplasmic adaptor subunit [bacterium]